MSEQEDEATRKRKWAQLRLLNAIDTTFHDILHIELKDMDHAMENGADINMPGGYLSPTKLPVEAAISVSAQDPRVLPKLAKVLEYGATLPKGVFEEVFEAFMSESRFRRHTPLFCKPDRGIFGGPPARDDDDLSLYSFGTMKKVSQLLLAAGADPRDTKGPESVPVLQMLFDKAAHYRKEWNSKTDQGYPENSYELKMAKECDDLAYYIRGVMKGTNPMPTKEDLAALHIPFDPAVRAKNLEKLSANKTPAMQASDISSDGKMSEKELNEQLIAETGGRCH